MTQVSIGKQTLGVDIESTQDLYRSLPVVDPTCCNGCATFLLALDRKILPRELTDLVSRMGIRLDRPIEVWGAPDGGFLQIWWPFVNTPDFEGFNPSQPLVELDPGIRCGITTHAPQPDWAISRDIRIPILEITWQHDIVQQLEAAL